MAAKKTATTNKKTATPQAQPGKIAKPEQKKKGSKAKATEVPVAETTPVTEPQPESAAAVPTEMLSAVQTPPVGEMATPLEIATPEGLLDAAAQPAAQPPQV